MPISLKPKHGLLKPRHSHTATALQHTHLNSVAALDWETMTEEEWKHQAFTEEFSATLEACPSEDCWVLMYAIQLLASCISLSPLLEMPATTQPQTMLTWGLFLCPSCQTHQCLNPASNSSVFHPAKACPTQGKKRRLSVTHPRSPPQEAETSSQNP